MQQEVRAGAKIAKNVDLR